MADDKTTILEEIIISISLALYQRWANELPEDARTEQSLAALAENASQTSFFVVQMFMDKFNEEAERLKN